MQVAETYYNTKNALVHVEEDLRHPLTCDLTLVIPPWQVLNVGDVNTNGCRRGVVATGCTCVMCKAVCKRVHNVGDVNTNGCGRGVVVTECMSL